MTEIGEYRALSLGTRNPTPLLPSFVTITATAAAAAAAIHRSTSCQLPFSNLSPLSHAHALAPGTTTMLMRVCIRVFDFDPCLLLSDDSLRYLPFYAVIPIVIQLPLAMLTLVEHTRTGLQIGD